MKKNKITIIYFVVFIFILTSLAGCTTNSNLTVDNRKLPDEKSVAESQNNNQEENTKTPDTSNTNVEKVNAAPNLDNEKSIDPINSKIPVDCIGHWAEPYIRVIIEKGLAIGYPDGSGLPDNPMTRIEVAAMIIKAAESQNILKSPDPKTIGKLPFKDDDKIPLWARGYLATTLKLGLLKGYEDITFKPDAKVTREEITVILARYFKLDNAPEKPLDFIDADKIEPWARSYVAKAYHFGIVPPIENNEFKPNYIVTRAEVAYMTVKGIQAFPQFLDPSKR